MAGVREVALDAHAESAVCKTGCLVEIVGIKAKYPGGAKVDFYVHDVSGGRLYIDVSVEFLEDGKWRGTSESLTDSHWLHTKVRVLEPMYLNRRLRLVYDPENYGRVLDLPEDVRATWRERPRRIRVKVLKAADVKNSKKDGWDLRDQFVLSEPFEFGP